MMRPYSQLLRMSHIWSSENFDLQLGNNAFIRLNTWNSQVNDCVKYRLHHHASVGAVP